MNNDLLEGLNDEQRQAVTYIGGPLMLVAGAGTGKTTVITKRIAWLIEQGHAKPENILALTFTDKAAGEMEERVDLLLPYGYADLQISTFHAFCETLLREYGVEIGLARDFRLTTELDGWLLARQHFDQFELAHYRPLGNPTKYLKSLLTHFSRAKDAAIDPDTYLAFVEKKKKDTDLSKADEEAVAELARLEELAHAYQTYQSILLEHDSLDFGDLILYSLKLLHERPTVLAKVQRRFTFTLVDEFQDTNHAQYELIRLLIGEEANVTIVGDDDQAIYKFRGASIENILRFERDYTNTKKIVLTQNYRSAQEVLDVSYSFIQKNNPHRLESQDERLNKKLSSNKEGKGVIEHIHCRTLQEEVEQVVKKIHALKHSTNDHVWNDFVILVRSNNAGTDFAEALEQHEIPFQFLALSGLYRKPVVLDIVSMLRVIDTPYNSPSFYRVLTAPHWQLSAMLITELNHLARQKGKSLFEACILAPTELSLDESDAARLQKILSVFTSLRSQAINKRSVEMFLLTLKETAYLSYINSLAEREKQENFSFLQQLYQRVKSFESRNDHPNLYGFLKEFDHERAAGEEGSLSVDMEAGPDMVRVMTIHAAKGLEFRHVFVVNMVDRRFPSQKRSEPIPLPPELTPEANEPDEAHLHEERRLFYVAATRAKEGLYLTSAEDYGGARKRKISRFLHELGYDQPELVDVPITQILEHKEPPSRANEEVVITLPKQFSFTQLAAFRTCPLQYKFAHVLKIPIFGKWTFSFGKTMHNTLQHFFETWVEREGTDPASAPKKPPVTREELMKLYEENWLDDWYVNDRQREEYREKGSSQLNAYYDSVEKDIPSPAFLEQAFTLKFGKIVIKGRIDRIDRFEDGIEIIDYKTGNPKELKKLSKEDKEQLLLYQMAATDVLGLIPKKLTFHYLQDNSSVSFLGSDKDLVSLRERIVERVQSIKDSNFKATPGFHCGFCDFADICEFRES